MNIQSKRAKELEAYINSHSDSDKGKQKIVIDGKVKLLDSYVIPISLLQYNHENRRFNLEIHEEETRLGRKLDPTDRSDVKRIKELLLSDQIEAKKLKEDLKRVGEQTDVAAVSYDGIVINGNRRMATLQELHEEEPTGKWGELWAVILPKDISESDLWKIEAGLQLSKEKVADYGPVNNLLMIKEGQRAGLSNAEIAASMYGWTEEQVKFDLERYQLMEMFLDYVGHKGNFGIIKKFRLAEYFQNIQKYTLMSSKREGIAHKEVQKRLEYNFWILRAFIQPESNAINTTHNDMRRVGNILSDDKAFSTLINGFKKNIDLRKVPISTVLDNYSNAKDVLENKKDRDKPKKLIERAITALKGIDRNGIHYKNSKQVIKKFKELDSLITIMKRELKIRK